MAARRAALLLFASLLGLSDNKVISGSTPMGDQNELAPTWCSNSSESIVTPSFCMEVQKTLRCNNLVMRKMENETGAVPLLTTTATCQIHDDNMDNRTLLAKSLQSLYCDMERDGTVLVTIRMTAKECGSAVGLRSSIENLMNITGSAPEPCPEVEGLFNGYNNALTPLNKLLQCITTLCQTERGNVLEMFRSWNQYHKQITA